MIIFGFTFWVLSFEFQVLENFQHILKYLTAGGEHSTISPSP